jgi:hypothetical protein
MLCAGASLSVQSLCYGLEDLAIILQFLQNQDFSFPQHPEQLGNSNNFLFSVY